MPLADLSLLVKQLEDGTRLFSLLVGRGYHRGVWWHTEWECDRAKAPLVRRALSNLDEFIYIETTASGLDDICIDENWTGCTKRRIEGPTYTCHGADFG